MGDRTFDDDFETAKQLIQAHKEYKLGEKKHWNEVRLDNESSFNNIQTKLRANKRKLWRAPEGYSVDDMDSHWDTLGEAERVSSNTVS